MHILQTYVCIYVSLNPVIQYILLQETDFVLTFKFHINVIKLGPLVICAFASLVRPPGLTAIQGRCRERKILKLAVSNPAYSLPKDFELYAHSTTNFDLMVSFQVRQLTNQDATESQIQEIVDFLTNAYYGDITAKAFVGGNWSILRDLKMAGIRATLLEGLVLIATIGSGSNEKIVSVGFWFGHGVDLFGRYTNKNTARVWPSFFLAFSF